MWEGVPLVLWSHIGPCWSLKLPEVLLNSHKSLYKLRKIRRKQTVAQG